MKRFWFTVKPFVIGVSLLGWVVYCLAFHFQWVVYQGLAVLVCLLAALAYDSFVSRWNKYPGTSEWRKY